MKLLFFSKNVPVWYYDSSLVLQASAEVSITVTDENEPPVFLNTPYIGKIPVPENSDVVIPDVVTVTARDYDFGSSQTVT